MTTSTTTRFFDKRHLAWLGFLFLALFHVYTILGESLNVPFSDDFAQQLSTAINLERGIDTTDALFRQHNVHRLFTTHVFTFIEHTFTGKVDINNQLLVALFFLLALSFVIGSYSSSRDRPVTMLIVGMILLSPAGGSTWVGGTTQYYALMLFSLLSIKWFFQIEKPAYLIGSIICMFLAVFSMIGGVLLPIIGCLYLFITRKIMKPASLIWSLAAVSCLLWYFYGFSMGNKNQPSIFYFVDHPRFSFEYTFRVLGNFFSGVIETELLTQITFIALSGFFYLIITKNSIKNLFFTEGGFAFVFLLLVVGSIIAGRVGFESNGTAYADRYYIITKSLWIMGFIVLMNMKLVSRDVLIFILGISALYMLETYESEVKRLKIHQLKQSNAMIDFTVRNSTRGFEYGANHSIAGRITSQAIALGVYIPELLPTGSRPLKYFKYSDYSDDLKINIIRDHTVNKYRYFAFTVDNDTKLHKAVIVPRDVFDGSATRLRPAALVEPYRLDKADLKASDGNEIYEIIIDTSKYDDSQTYDVFVISLGMITHLGTLLKQAD